ncbi:MAG: bifunctional phosphoribosylaminoimidazolecarboxamide formyltransferase/IMP cyclohydrolase [Candidatus Thermoplasmatota archaeon]
MTYKTALISVSDKTDIVDLAEALVNMDFRIISTGGTASFLKKAGLEVIEVSNLTGFPEILDGRVKTLHPIVHAGILADRSNKEHIKTLKNHGIQTIELVVCNLYPFETIIKKKNASIKEIIENIDIGGPTLIRSAAKNHEGVIVVTNPSQYPEIINLLKTKKDVPLDTRRRLALEAYAHTAQYDTIIFNYLKSIWMPNTLVDNYTFTMRKIQDMRYGENPHQRGAFYRALPLVTEPCIANTRQIHGKELSFNNILDSDCAIECVKEFKEPSCVIIKHATPCGIATASNLLDAWKDAYATDVYSPFGGIVCFNRVVEKDVAEELSQYFLEVIIAPAFKDNALHVLEKKKNLRLLECQGLDKTESRDGLDIRSVVGGYLVQDRDVWFKPRNEWRVVTEKKPSPDDLHSMDFAVRCVKHVKSNSVLFVKGTRTVAIGGGQTSRVDATWIATFKGKDNIKGSIMASDAFFPFRDAVDVAAKAGVAAIVQPGGSVRDAEVIQAANEHGIIMVFTGQRYFKH